MLHLYLFICKQSQCLCTISVFAYPRPTVKSPKRFFVCLFPVWDKGITGRGGGFHYVTSRGPAVVTDSFKKKKKKAQAVFFSVCSSWFAIRSWASLLAPTAILLNVERLWGARKSTCSTFRKFISSWVILRVHRARDAELPLRTWRQVSLRTRLRHVRIKRVWLGHVRIKRVCFTHICVLRTCLESVFLRPM